MQHSIFLPAATVFLCTFIIIHFSNHLTTSANGERHFLGDIAINCGCFSNSTALDGRRWVGETPLIQPKGKSRSTTISAGNLLTSDPTPFFTARISSTQFSYSFQVNPGQKFLRLHFCPAPYQEGFRNSQDIFSVKANSFTLLQNFSASLAADALGVKYFVKEFCLNVNETGILQITFSASRRISKSSSNTFVFVNGIEIISMPTGLYYTPDDDLGARVIGQSNGFNKVDNNIALELVQRLNVGGGSVLPVEDTGLFRSWSEDVDYMFASSGFQQIKHMLPAPASITPPFLAPLKIYQTSRIFNKGLDSVKKHHVTWKIPVDLGFCYLLRLHFGSFIGESSEGSPTDFSTLIQNDIAESQVNVIKLSGGDGITVYRDYMVMMRGDKADGKSDLSISLQSVDVLNLGLLKGLEIFKLSNIDNSLASPNPSSPIRNSSFWFMKIRKFQVAFGHLNVIMTALTILLAIVNIAFYRLRQVCEHGFVQDKHVQSAPDEPASHHFSLAEILLATRNFDDALVVGRGGFGKVYKGLVYGRPEVLAIKRLKPDSNQGAHEFWREIETLSKLRHIHLVPLIGYCNESGEMILVYEYMPRGTVADNIYKARMNGKEGIPLSWEQRLRICIGAARGLDYLHTGTQYGVIHRDVKATNILLDENYVAKISDFGLSKQGSTDNTQGQLSTKVWGTAGYLDPHYIATRKPSITSDVYAFGIVLLVVLSGRPAVETKFFSENVSLLACFQECMEKGEMKDIIDPSMQGEISVESLTKFIEAVVNCVHHLPKKRPSMAQVVVFLEHALNGVGSSKCDKAVVDALLQKLANADLEEQRAAARVLRLLARRNPENRVCITEAGAIPFLVGLLSSPDSRTQEHSVTALLNLSIYDANKMTIVNAGAIPGIVNLLKNGSIEARENAAATLFSLALIDENKVAIGAAGAIPDLVDLLSHGTPRGKKDAATAIFNLLIYQGNKGKAVRAGIVPPLMQLLKDPRSGLADDALAILTLLATNPEGGFAIGQSDPIPILVEVIGTGSPRNRENAAAILWSLCTCDVKLLRVAQEFGVKEALKEMSVNGTDRGKQKADSVLELLQRIEGYC